MTKPPSIKRAKIACRYCRHRKVRCDATDKVPCMQCRLDDVKCEIVEHKDKRRRRPSLRPVDRDSKTSGIVDLTTLLSVADRLEMQSHALRHPLSKPPSKLGNQTGWTSKFLQCQLLLGFIQFVHPLIPVLSRSSIREMIEWPNPQQKNLSSLLFHAILYSGIPHVPTEVLLSHGFPSNDEAGRAFRLKFKLLYRCQQEADQADIIHALLLMSSWSPYGDAADTIQWSSSAILKMSNICKTVKDGWCHVEKRLGWTCFVRAQLISYNRREAFSTEMDELPESWFMGLEVAMQDDDRAQDMSDQRLKPFEPKNETPTSRKFARYVGNVLCLQRVLCVTSKMKVTNRPPLHQNSIERIQVVLEACLDQSRKHRDDCELVINSTGVQQREEIGTDQIMHETFCYTIELMTLVELQQSMDTIRQVWSAASWIGHDEEVRDRIRTLQTQLMHLLQHLYLRRMLHHLSSHITEFLLQRALTEAVSYHGMTGSVGEAYASGFQTGLEIFQNLHEFEEDNCHMDYRTRFLYAAVAATFSACGNSLSSVLTDEFDAAPGLVISASPSLPTTSGSDSPSVEDVHSYAKASDWHDKESISIDPKALCMVAIGTSDDEQLNTDAEEHVGIDMGYSPSTWESTLASADNDFDKLIRFGENFA